MEQPAGSASGDIAAMGDPAVKVPLSDLRQNCDECVSRKVKCVMASSAGCISCLRKRASCLFSMKLMPGPGSGRRRILDGEPTTPPTGQFTAQQVQQARGFTEAAKQAATDLSHTEDESDTDETGKETDVDGDEGSPLPNDKSKGKKRGRKQPRGEVKGNKIARTNELLGTPRAAKTGSVGILGADMGDAAGIDGVMPSEIGSRPSLAAVFDSKKQHSAVPKRAASVGTRPCFLSTWGNDVKLRAGSKEEMHRMILAVGGMGVMGTKDGVGRSFFESGARPLTSEYIIPRSRTTDFLKPFITPLTSSSTSIDTDKTGGSQDAARATREKPLQSAYRVLTFAPEEESELARDGGGPAAALGRVGRVEPPKWVRSLNQDQPKVASHGQAKMSGFVGHHANGNTVESVVATAERGQCEAGAEVGGKGCTGGGDSGRDGQGGKVEESHQRTKSWEGLGVEDTIFLDKDVDESDVESGGLPCPEPVGEEAGLKTTMRNPGIGAPPSKIGNLHPNIGNAGTCGHPYALRHRMSGYICRGLSRKGNSASGGNGHHSYKTGQTYERAGSTNDCKKDGGGGIPDGVTGRGGEVVDEAKRGLRWTGAGYTPVKSVTPKRAEGRMRPTGFREVANSCRANPANSTGYMKGDASIRGFGVAGIANKNKCNMAVSSRGTFRGTFGSTICPSITPSPIDGLDSKSCDRDIASFLNDGDDWSDFYSEHLNPSYDVAFDDFFDV